MTMKDSKQALEILEAELDLLLNRDADLQRDPREPVAMLQGVRTMLGSLEARRLARN
jgi:hypothetical protein